MSEIIHIIGHLRYGAGRYIVDLACVQNKLFRHKVTVAVSCDIDSEWSNDARLKEELHNQGIAVFEVGEWFQRDLGELLKSAHQLRTLIRSGTADALIHAHSAMAAVVGRLAGAPVVVATCHGWSPNRPELYDQQDIAALSASDGITTPSRFWSRILEARLYDRRVRVIRPGINLCEYPPPPRKRLAQEPHRIVTVCELVRRKGVDILVQAMPYIWEVDESIELHVLGDGPERKALEEAAKKTDHMNARIFFHGRVLRPYEKLSEFDVFCLASRADNCPVALIEGLLAGLPLVGTEAGGIPELIREANAGEVAPNYCPQELAAALLRILKSSNSERTRLGSSGREYAVRNFDIRETAVQTEKAYEEGRTTALASSFGAKNRGS
jgi:glycosyltransferase involved in cell wall biosynthesis